MQNAYTDDAFSSPQQTLERIRQILTRHAAASERLEKGELLDTILKERA
jgi:V/A-type H+/Na+-transporting ATPase subunit A